MTKQELKWFNALHEDRVQVTSMMLRPEFIHMFNEAIDKYSESAHFIYELLQNADDAGASKAEVILEADKLIFKHNGNVRFTISDPSLPVEEARSKGMYGHINSITALGFSTKNKETGEGNKIGKFGVGFKAVFQYTNTPEIYDDVFKFKIEKYIIPVLLEEDHAFRQKGETLFVFPFKEPQKAYEDIVDRIENLNNPILFLTHLREIKITIDDVTTQTYKYSKKILCSMGRR